MGEQTGGEALEEALVVLRREAGAAPSRELSLAMTKTEEALMWRQRVCLPDEPGAEAESAQQGAPEQAAP